MEIEIRAKSVIKITTGVTNIDYEYQKGTNLKTLIGHLAILVIADDGVDATSDFFDEMISKANQ